jgi:hypothetical protein
LLCIFSFTKLRFSGSGTGNPSVLDGTTNSGGPLLPEAILNSVRSLSAPEPSSAALQAHISDLESELRTTEFRLHFLYHQRSSLIILITEAKKQLDQLST